MSTAWSAPERRALAACSIAWALAWIGAPALAQQRGAPPLPLRVAVVERDGARVVEPRWIDQRLAEANRVLGAAGVTLRLAGVASIPDAHARLETRADRNRLATHVEPGVINLFVVATLMDVDEPGRERRGVHWRERASGARYVIVSAIATWPAIFAHELGHYFGLPHSDTPNAVMSYTQDGETPPFLEAREIAIVRRSARRAIASGELRP